MLSGCTMCSASACGMSSCSWLNVALSSPMRLFGAGARNSAGALPTACAADGRGPGTSGTWTRCSSGSRARPNRPRTSCPLTHSSMATSTHAAIFWQLTHIVHSGLWLLMSGTPRDMRPIRDMTRTDEPFWAPARPSEVNVTMPSRVEVSGIPDTEANGCPGILRIRREQSAGRDAPPSGRNPCPRAAAHARP
jgi:hypothetical protein